MITGGRTFTAYELPSERYFSMRNDTLEPISQMCYIETKEYQNRHKFDTVMERKGNTPMHNTNSTQKPETQSQLLADRQKLAKLAVILKNSNISVFEYLLSKDTFILYDDRLQVSRTIPDYLSHLKTDGLIHPEDHRKVVEFFQMKRNGPLEIRVIAKDNNTGRKILDASLITGNDMQPDILVGTIKDVTLEREREELLENQAKRDSLTMLYNHISGKELINEYLADKNPYASCGLMVIDIDYFKNVNDSYGHLFGDTVLMALSRLFLSRFASHDIVMRAGGDEFVVFLKDISHSGLVKKANELVKSVRELTFEESSYSPTCSVGVCFLPENTSGYTYDHLFGNADWALYKAKEKGKNRYEFCDNLQRFQLSLHEEDTLQSDIDVRYLHNDIISTAFEIFEKMNCFDSAIELLLQVIGIRFQLDRITIIRMDTRTNTAGRQYQWTSSQAPKTLDDIESFTKEDFLTLFHSFDEYGTTVIQHDNLHMYSPQAARLFTQGEAKTTVFAAMYCEGKYTGAISYVVCGSKRYWSKQNRSQLGELTKIISAHLAKKLAMNASHQGITSSPEYDPLTGLLSFSRFREEVERIIVGGYATSHVMVYSDFENFKYFNQKWGYSTGDQLLKEFANYIIGTLRDESEVYFTRVVADQFIIFMPFDHSLNAEDGVRRINEEFIRQQAFRYPDIRLRIRTGIYYVQPDCISASAAIDAANYARKQLKDNFSATVQMFDEGLSKQQKLENEILSGMISAMQNHEFKIYLQPKFSMKDFSIVGAEALVRWQKADGTILYPNSFVPLYERNGRIIDLDFYIFEEVVAFLAKNNRLGRRQIPISVNASILHASNESTVKRYLEILNSYHINPALTEIELTETATVSDYDNVKKLFQSLQSEHIRTSLDDFGAGYSVLNTVIDIPVNTVKLDRVLITSCESSEKGIYFLRQIVRMIKGLGYHIVCEGVETKEQALILKNMGCDEGQGYWFSRPLPIEEYERLVYPDK